MFVFLNTDYFINRIIKCSIFGLRKTHNIHLYVSECDKNLNIFFCSYLNFYMVSNFEVN